MAVSQAFLEMIVEVPAFVGRLLAKLLHESPIARQLRVDVVQLDREVENDVQHRPVGMPFLHQVVASIEHPPSEQP